MFETLNESPLTQWLNSLLWGFPAAEIFHIVMTGGFFGGVAALDLRLLGVHRRVSVMTLMQHLVLIVCGGLNALFMHVALLRHQYHWDSHIDPPGGVKMSALLSLVIWMATLGCGRLIAYFYGTSF